MKILFVCGSLEPGRDGVGDYTRVLARGCAAQGHDCTVLALHDPAVARPSDATPENVRLIRLPAADPWPDRLACARGHVRRIAPDWVSWQVVAYAFHPRGFLPAALLRAAPELRGGRCHVMLHELWLGLETGASWRSRATGWLQRRGLLCLLDQLEPDCVQTTNPTYQHALQREGLAAGVLPLFGNVPVADQPAGGRPLAPWLPVPAADPGPAPFVALTFGTLHPQWQPAATIAWLLATARRHRRTPALIAVGRTGARAAPILAAFRRAGVAVGVTGELDAVTVSHLLAGADLGIAPHPWALIGKSGAAAAMLEHGLPVLVPRDDWHLRSDASPAPAASDSLLVRLAGLDPAGTDRWLALRRAPASVLTSTVTALLATLGGLSPRLAASGP